MSRKPGERGYLSIEEKHTLRAHFLSGRLQAEHGRDAVVSLTPSQWSYVLWLMNDDMGLTPTPKVPPPHNGSIRRRL